MKRLIFLAAFLLAISSPASPQFNGCQAGFCAPKAATSSSNLTAIEGAAQGSITSSGTTCTATITTGGTNRLVMAYVSANSAGNIAAGATFSGGGLTWVSDTTVNNSPTNTQADTLGYAPASTQLTSQTITATLPATVSFCTLMVWAVSGYNVGSPFDGATVSGTSTPQSITTTNPNDMVVAGWTTNDGTAAPAAGACCSLIVNPSAQFQGSESAKLISAQTLSVDAPNSAGRAVIVKAIKSQ